MLNNVFSCVRKFEKKDLVTLHEHYEKSKKANK